MRKALPLCTAILAACALAGCWGDQGQKNDQFHTSGSKEADQRAEQIIAKDQQINGKQAGDNSATPTLYTRLGGDVGIAAIVDDWINRSMADPRVNFVRKDVNKGGVLGVGGSSATWNGDAQNVKMLKLHMSQFLDNATGGPIVKYQGKDMKAAHQGLQITNDEFDACIGDMKASLDAHHIPSADQEALLAILEQTRPQVVEKR